MFESLTDHDWLLLPVMFKKVFKGEISEFQRQHGSKVKKGSPPCNTAAQILIQARSRNEKYLVRILPVSALRRTLSVVDENT
ncbi:MAG: hypothetical protein Q8Q81_17430 [Oxalobacteraceae bacterium]|nr:hypothetical protein [Oxalobacteraceae bacterium]